LFTSKIITMKKIFTLLSVLGIISSSFAQWQQNPQQYPNQNGGPRQNSNYNQNSSLIVSSASQRQVSVYVDSYQYQSNGNNGEINVGQLSSGNHNIIIYEMKKNFWGKTVQQEVYNSNLYLKPGVETTLFINNLGQVSISERQLNNNNNGNYDNGNGPGNNGNGVGYGYGRKKNKHKNKKEKCDDDHDNRGNNGNGRGRGNKGGRDDD
jgi:hypothetical protein